VIRMFFDLRIEGHIKIIKIEFQSENIDRIKK
jgi:hypothetical protein